MDTAGPDISWLVVVNNEDQFSIWPSRLIIPKGWKAITGKMTRNECLKYIEINWKDMRPKSYREKAESEARGMLAMQNRVHPAASLADKLCSQWHKIDLAQNLESSAELRDRILSGYVILRFTETFDPVNMVTWITPHERNAILLDLDRGAGIIQIRGALRLDGIDAVCEATIELATLNGQARLVRDWSGR